MHCGRVLHAEDDSHLIGKVITESHYLFSIPWFWWLSGYHKPDNYTVQFGLKILIARGRIFSIGSGFLLARQHAKCTDKFGIKRFIGSMISAPIRR